MKYKQSKEFSFVAAMLGNAGAGVIGYTYLGHIPFGLAILFCLVGAGICGMIPKMYGIIIHGDYW